MISRFLTSLAEHFNPAAGTAHSECDLLQWCAAETPGYPLDRFIEDLRLLRVILFEELEAHGPVPHQVRASILDAFDQAILGAARGHTRIYQASLQLLSEASQTLSGTLEYEATLGSVARLAIPALADWCLVDVLQENGTVRRVAVTRRPQEDPEVENILRQCPPDPLSDNPAAQVIRSGRSLLWSDVTPDQLLGIAQNATHADAVRRIAPQSVLSVPLMARGRCLGSITLVHAQSGRHFCEADLPLVQELANRSALALDNARLFDELHRADENKTQFLALLGHELRNPLGPIRNAVCILEGVGLPDPRQQRALETIKRQLRHEARLLDDLLNVTRIARGKLLLHFQAVDLSELVRSAVEDHRAEIESQDLSLEVSVPEAQIWVRGDSTRLGQVLGNLLQNAMKFTDAGGEIHVSLERSESGHWAELAIADTGIGMRPESLPYLFDAFAQEDRSRSLDKGGLGLGLALARGLVEMHGGEIRAASAGPGRGSVFTVLLPIDDSLEPAPAPRSEDRVTSAGLRVVIIEDNADAAETLRDLLELFGHQVTLARDGSEGVRLVRELRPQVVLCDIGLPGMNGYEIAHLLRQDPGLSGVRLIAITGFGQAEDRHRAQEAGFDEHLVKPVDPESLQRLLGRIARSL